MGSRANLTSPVGSGLVEPNFAGDGPMRGWGQFYNGDTVLRDKLIVSGHSQGAGMAGMLAKTRRVDRCLMFTDMDWGGGRPALQLDVRSLPDPGRSLVPAGA